MRGCSALGRQAPRSALLRPPLPLPLPRCGVSAVVGPAMAPSPSLLSAPSLLNLPPASTCPAQRSHPFAPLQRAGEELIQRRGHPEKRSSREAVRPRMSVCEQSAQDVVLVENMVPASTDSPKQKQKSKSTNMKLVFSVINSFLLNYQLK